ncbi:glutathione synthetase [Aspergillus vadensis CBS 113365]|uniref:Glutathione synthetase n=1 Tax=Aspergillus vadensis (strain CBS 113365 / IMI 142717 / IBT 24658) TaxID=1448311 RepID=A0A319BAL5_ASPVC|nr:glutathione synthetase [Aspergillus vadensis CBS 113365]PYH69635.1 glutathione synthetase [Aspergillus vadensis CBS 113365]
MYPPRTPEPLSDHLTTQILNYQLTHGMHLKHIHPNQPQPSHNITSSSSSYPISTSIFPTPFPRALFHHAHTLQPIYNELYARLSENESWLYNSVIKPLLPVDSFARTLWEIHLRMKSKRGGGYGSDISMGLFRSDYMLHVSGNDDGDQEEEEVEVGISLEESENAGLRLKQVEFNTIACAGGCHAKKVVDMHRYLTRTGAYDGSLSDANGGERKSPIKLSSLPTNENIKGLADSLATAHDIYGPARCDLATKTGVLFIVQPDNFNVADELPIEYALWDRDVPVPTYRVEWGEDVLERTCLGGNRELLFYPHLQGEGSRPVEVSVVYLRAGLEVHEYDAAGIECRVRLEQSRAIKCPSVLGHVLTFKKVQQALMGLGVLERFLDSEEKVSVIRDTFVGMYPMDGDSEEGHYARGLATDHETAWRYILKPSLEGGGHNIYGEDIPGFLLGMISESEWGRYVLMERIRSPVVGNVLMSRMGVEESDVVSELGVFGLCIWKKGEILTNETVGWSLKTKFADVDEMSVVKGFGCFDTPLLV